jgi:hypothetical protein
MAKNKKPQEIYVVKPVIGERYYFRFAGTLMYGPILSMCDSLTKMNGHAWYWFTCDKEGIKTCKYPVSIYNISKKLEDV